jgi:hypothetical protein
MSFELLWLADLVTPAYFVADWFGKIGLYRFRAEPLGDTSGAGWRGPVGSCGLRRRCSGILGCDGRSS